jgi:hypothetical protein
LSSYHLATSTVGVLLAAGILLLVRRDHLHARRAVFWLAMAGAALLFGVVPEASDWLAARLGVGYPPVLVLLCGQVVLTFKLLLVDMHNTRIEHDLRRLNQRLALYELEAAHRTELRPAQQANGHVPDQGA